MFQEYDANVTPTFSILSFNVRCKDEAFIENQNEVANVILKDLPDIVFLTEFELSYANSLDAKLRESKYQRFYIKGSNSCFYSKFPIKKVEEINTIPEKGNHCFIIKANVCIQCKQASSPDVGILDW